MMIIKTTITPASPPITHFRMKHSDNSGMTENIIILNLFFEIEPPPQCGIYTLGQLSKLFVLIRLEETNKIGVKRGYYFFSSLIDSIR
jgi:hypothetical protein